MKRRFFIALLPPQPIQDQVTEIKQYFADVYKSKDALKSPPHITLQPPFEWLLEELPSLEESVKSFTQNQVEVPIRLSGFAAFAPRVIYVNVIKTPELMGLQQQVMAHMETSLSIVDPVSKTRSFTPHMTVAFHDLTRQNFRAAWPEFQDKPFEFQFTVSQLTLLIHDGQCWTIHREFALNQGL